MSPRTLARMRTEAKLALHALHFVARNMTEAFEGNLGTSEANAYACLVEAIGRVQVVLDDVNGLASGTEAQARGEAVQ